MNIDMNINAEDTDTDADVNTDTDEGIKFSSMDELFADDSGT
jgi:hypothetical protein